MCHFRIDFHSWEMCNWDKCAVFGYIGKFLGDCAILGQICNFRINLKSNECVN